MISFRIRSRTVAVIVGVSAAFLSCTRQHSNELDSTHGDEAMAYGFAAPGIEPELFAFDLVGNDAAQLAIAVSPTGEELFYSQLRRDDNGFFFDLLRSECVDGQWTEPEQAPFVSDMGEIEAFFNNSGERLYFFSRRPAADSVERSSPWNLWYVDKTNGHWGKPSLLGQPDSLVVFNWSANLLNDTTLFFTARPYDNHRLAEIYEVSIAGNRFGELLNVGPGVNTRDHTENEPALAPDGSYMVFYSAGRPDNLSSELLGDLYISFRGADGIWQDAIRLAEPINSAQEENWPRISPDGNYLFFSSNRREGAEMPDLYWVSTDAFERYRSN